MLDVARASTAGTTSRGAFAPAAQTVLNRPLPQTSNSSTAVSPSAGTGAQAFALVRRQRAAAEGEADNRRRQARREWQAQLATQWAEEEQMRAAAEDEARANHMNLIYLMAYMEMMSEADGPHRGVIRKEFKLPTDPDE